MSLISADKLPTHLFDKLKFLYGKYSTYSFKLASYLTPSAGISAEDELDYLTDSLCSTNYFSEFLDWGDDYEFTHDGKGNGELTIKIQCDECLSKAFDDYETEEEVTGFISYISLLPQNNTNDEELAGFIKNLCMKLYEHKRACDYVIRKLHSGDINALLSNEPIEIDPDMYCITCHHYHPNIKGNRDFTRPQTLYCSQCCRIYDMKGSNEHMENYNKYLRYLIGDHTIKFTEIIEFLKNPIPKTITLKGAPILGAESGVYGDRGSIFLTLE